MRSSFAYMADESAEQRHLWLAQCIQMWQLPCTALLWAVRCISQQDTLQASKPWVPLARSSGVNCPHLLTSFQRLPEP